MSFIRSTLATFFAFAALFLFAGTAYAGPSDSELTRMVEDAQKTSVTIYARSQTDDEGNYYDTLGSGTIVTPGGIVLTNCHVTCDMAFIQVKANDGTRYRAEFIAGSGQGRGNSDVAFIRLRRWNHNTVFPYAPRMDSTTLKPGETIITIGAPLGLERTVTRGIVSALNRNVIGSEGDDIQHDSLMLPGNSGGGLWAIRNNQLELVGMNTYMVGGGANEVQRPGQGLSFAVSMNTIEHYMRRLHDDDTDIRQVPDHREHRRNLSYTSIYTPYIGVTPSDVEPEVALMAGVPKDLVAKGFTGVNLAVVDMDSPAAKAGLKAGDVVFAFAEQPVKDAYALQRMVRFMGEEPVRVDYTRNGNVLTTRVTARDISQNFEPPVPEAYDGLLGADVTGPGMWEKLTALGNTPEGVRIERVYNMGPAHEAGLRNGDRITGFIIPGKGRVVIRNTTDLTTFYRQLGKLMADNNQEQTVVVAMVAQEVETPTGAVVSVVKPVQVKLRPYRN